MVINLPALYCASRSAVGLLVGILLFSVSLANAQNAKLQRFEYSTAVMGVRLNIVVYGQSEKDVETAILQAVEQVRECDRIFSNYTESSEIARLEKVDQSSPVKTSDRLFDLLAISRQIHDSSDGAFDVTLGSLTRLWRDIRKQGTMPDRATLQKAIAVSGFDKLKMDIVNHTVQFPSGLQFDFGGIAKGFAAHQALVKLQDMGITSALVDLGGDIAIGDPPPGKPGWRIAIASLEDKLDETRCIEVGNCGVATSGDKEQFVEIDGVRYSHILNPKTGLGIQRQSSVTVWAPNATVADGWASAISVLDRSSAKHKIANMNATAFLVQERIEGKVVETSTRLFPEIQTSKKR